MSGRDRVTGSTFETVGTVVLPQQDSTPVDLAAVTNLLEEIAILKKKNDALYHLALKSISEPKTQPSRPAFPATALRRQHQTIGLLTLKDFLESQ